MVAAFFVRLPQLSGLLTTFEIGQLPKPHDPE